MDWRDVWETITLVTALLVVWIIVVSGIELILSFQDLWASLCRK